MAKDELTLEILEPEQAGQEAAIPEYRVATFRMPHSELVKALHRALGFPTNARLVNITMNALSVVFVVTHPELPLVKVGEDIPVIEPSSKLVWAWDDPPEPEKLFAPPPGLAEPVSPQDILESIDKEPKDV